MSAEKSGGVSGVQVNNEGANTVPEGDTRVDGEDISRSTKVPWRAGGVSFRDKVLGGEVGNFPKFSETMLQNGVKLSFEGGNSRRPMVFFDDCLVEAMSLPCKDALVVKVLGLFQSYTAMREKLRVIWKLSAGFEVMDVGNGYFMIKFDHSEDREKVIAEGPWMLNNHYLAVKKWSPDFNPLDDCFERTMVWVRFPSLNLMYYDEGL